jgi:predicted DNA-binding transcriptional regulator YafY
MPSLIAQPLIEHFIRSRLYWFGHIGRQNIVSTFGVGTAYASRLLSAMRKELPVKPAGKEFSMPIEGTQAPEGVSSQRFLNDLYFSAITRADPTSVCGEDVPHTSMDAFRRQIPEEILRPIVRALQGRSVIEIEYIGMNVGDQVKTRVIEPLRLVHVGGRWHINAHCHSANGKRDFVLSRILGAKSVQRASKADPMLDFAQDGAVAHKYEAHPLLCQQQKEVVWREFGMQEGVLEVWLSDSELFYFEQQYVAMSDEEKPPFKLLVKANSQ